MNEEINERFLYSLRNRSAALNSEISEMQEYVSEKQKELSSKRIEFDKINNFLNTGKVEISENITEHAIIRFHERVNNLELKKPAIDKLFTNYLKLEMLTNGGNGTFNISQDSDISVVVKDWKIITVYNGHQ